MNKCIPSRVMVYEPGYTGHRLNYVRLIIEGCASIGIEPIVVLHEQAKHTSEFSVHLSGIEEHADIQFVSRISPDAGMMVKQWEEACELSRLVRRLKPHYTYVPVGDGIGQMLGLRHFFKTLPTNMETIVFAGRAIAPPPNLLSSLKYRFFAAALQRVPWNGVHLIAPVTLKWFERYAPRLYSRVNIIADPVPKLQPTTKRQAQSKLGLDSAARWIGCLGPLNRRKGIDCLVNAFFGNGSGPAGCKLFLAGPLDGDLFWIKDTYGAHIADGTLVLRDTYLSNEDFQAALFALDVLCLPYKGTRWASSGLLLQAVAANLPVLVADRGWTATTTRAYRLGDTVNTEDISAFHETIRKSLGNSGRHRISDEAKAWLEFNSEENFRAQVLYSLKRDMGATEGHLPPDGNAFYADVL